MIEFLLALHMQAASPPATISEQEIVVTARRLKTWRGRVSASAKGSRCKTVKSTGDRDLDQIACDTLRYCIAQFTPDLVAATSLARKVRDERLRIVNQRLEACGNEQHALRVADFLDRRALARMNHARD